MDKKSNEIEKDKKVTKRRRRKEKPRKLRHNYSSQKARGNFLNKARVATTNVNKYPEIKQPLIDWGLNESVLLNGVDLCDKAEEAWNKQENLKSMAELRLYEFKEFVKEKRGLFLNHLGLARIGVGDNVHYRVSLGLKSRLHHTVTGFLDKAVLFYQNALNIEGLAKALKKVGLTREILQAGLDMIAEVDEAERIAHNAKSDAMLATIARDDAFEALSLWMRSFTHVCKIVFSDGPQQQTLERLGIPAITTKKRRKKNGQPDDEDSSDSEPENN